ncbi:DUF1275 family protein [Streptomyces hoynatensis]|nr:DUF1275 family protein [Streptomyces hoynatensis]
MGVPARLMVALSLLAGGVDAVAFLTLDHVFVANQTGNGVLLGLGAASRFLPGDAGVGLTGPLASLAGFCAGGLAAAGLSRRAPLRALLWLEAALLGLAGALAWAPAPWCAAALAAAMGAQTVFATRVGIKGVTTTVVTSTLATLFLRLLVPGAGAGRDREAVALLLAVWLAYLAGVLAGTSAVLPAL